MTTSEKNVWLSNNYHNIILCVFDKFLRLMVFVRMVMEEVRIKHYSDRYPSFDGRKNLFCSGKKGKLFNGDEVTYFYSHCDIINNS